MKIRIIRNNRSHNFSPDPITLIVGGLLLAGIAGVVTLLAPIVLAVLTGIGIALAIWGGVLFILERLRR